MVWVKKIFNTNLDNLKVFKSKFGKKKQYFYYQIIQENESVIIDGDKFFPFINIEYSYNSVNAIHFNIGIYRSYCSNGMIFGLKNLAGIKIFPNNLFDFPFWLNKCLLDYLINNFETQIKILKRTTIVNNDIINFLNNKTNWQINKNIINFYLSEMGNTGYALLNILTDSASNEAHESIAFNKNVEITPGMDTFNNNDKNINRVVSRQMSVGIFLEELIQNILTENNSTTNIDINSKDFLLTDDNINQLINLELKDKYVFSNLLQMKLK